MKCYDTMGCVLLAAACVAPLQPVRAAEPDRPQAVTLAVYDTGFAMVNELRRATVSAGESTVTWSGLPAKLDPASVGFTLMAGARDFSVLEQRFVWDAATPERLAARYQGRSVSIRVPGVNRQGVLLDVLRDASDQPVPLLRGPDSVAEVFGLTRGGEMVFPTANDVYYEPALLWRVRAAEDGVVNLRLSYRADGLRWTAAYDVILDAAGTAARLAARVGLLNASGGRYAAARVRLILTERGLVPPLATERPPYAAPATDQPAQRYAYGQSEPMLERELKGFAPVQTYDLAETVTLEDGQTLYASLASAENVPVRRSYVYDGVRFDRFQRNRRNDWNYGTEFQPDVETYLEFDNETRNGLGSALPPGRLRLYRQGEEGALDLLGEAFLNQVAAGGQARLRIGASRGLRGERERTNYTEIRPLHEYEESFEIRLVNDSEADATLRVVEHLYRWQQFEIVKADTEFKATGPQTIEFTPLLKAGGKRSIHYTVRYTW